MGNIRIVADSTCDLSAELKAYTEALEDYKDKSNNVYKQRIDLLMEGLDSNANHNEEE